MIRLFFDANILFTAAHNPDGKAFLIISLGIEGAWELYTSAFAAEEARRNIAIKYSSLEKRLSALLSSMTIAPEMPDAPYPSNLDEKDRPIFQAAYACRASHLITGDIAHFGPLMNAKSPRKTYGMIIQTPAMFLDSL